MNPTKRRLAVLACVVTLVGPPGLGGVACTRPPSKGGASNGSNGGGNPTASISSPIQGGASDTTSTFAVAVIPESNQTCSGTLIAPNLVLTARHCIADDNGGSFVDCTADEFEAPYAPSSIHVSTATSATFNTATYAGKKILVPTETKFCGNDIALIIIDAKIPSSEAKPAAPAIDSNATNTYGTKVTAIGYGTTEPGGNDDGSRRRRDNVPLQCVPGDTANDCDPSDFSMVAKELATGDGLCEGDSGSGAYITASIAAGKTPTVIGVLSRASDTGVKCTDAVFTRTDAFRAFLIAGAKEASTAGGYPLPAWAGGDGGVEEEPGGEDASSPPRSNNPNDVDPPDAAAGAPAAPGGNDKGCQLGSGGAAAAAPSFGAALIFAGIALAMRRRRRRRRTT